MEIKKLSQNFIDLLHDQAIQLDHIYDDINSLYDSYGGDTPSLNELTPLHDECNEIYAVCDTIIQNSISAIKAHQKKHGGTRSGAGRKRAAPTKQIRVDADLSDQFKMLSDLYRSQSPTDRALILEGLTSVGVSS